jgi:hypothetical protein
MKKLIVVILALISLQVMSQQDSITYLNKSNPVPVTNRQQQATAEDFNEIKSVINNNAGDASQRFSDVYDSLDKKLNAADTNYFSGDYDDLTNKPIIPTDNSQLTNGAAYMDSATYDPQGIEGDVFDLNIHTGQISISNVEGLQDSLDKKSDSAIYADTAFYADTAKIAKRADTATYALNAIDSALYADTSGVALNVSEANNGLTKTGNNIGLGGSMNQNTVINGNSYDLDIGAGGSAFDQVTTRARYIVEAATQGWLWEWDESDELTFDGTGLKINNQDVATENYVQVYHNSNQPALPYNYDYVFSSSTTNERPGPTFVRFNNANISSVTQIYIDDFDRNSVDKENFIQLADTGSVLYVESEPFNGSYAVYTLSGGLIDSTGYTTYKVSHLFSNGGNFLSDNDDITLVLELTGSGGGSAVADSLLVSHSDTLTLVADTLRGEGIIAKFKGIFANWFNGDYILVDSVGFKSGGWITGLLNTAKFQVDTLERNVDIVGQGVNKDTLVGATSLDASLKSGVDYITVDTLSVDNDTVTAYELSQTVRKILYPNDYSSYLPVDSLYTTPTISVSLPTKILIPTVVKYTNNWALFDKGGSDFALQFMGSDSSRFHIDMTTSLTTSASNVIVDLYMYKNGLIEPGVAIERKVGTGTDTGALAITGSFDAAQNDYIEIFVEVDVASTITFKLTSIRIKEDGTIMP